MRNLLAIAALVQAIACSSSAGSGGSAATKSDTLNRAADTGTATETAGVDTANAQDSVALETAPDDANRIAQDTAPPEPCAQVVGKLMCNLESQGYIRDETTGLATSAPFAPSFVIAEVMAKVTQKYAVVFLGAWW